VPAVARKLVAWFKASPPWEAWQRFVRANGNLLAAGVGYFAFFSIFPALALAFAIFGFVLQNRPDMLSAITDSINAALPGMVKTPSTPNGIISIEAPASLTLTITGIISFFTLLYAGLGWVGAMRIGIRAVFGLEARSDTMVRTKARDLFVLVSVGVAVAASAVITSMAGGLAGTVAAWVGLAGSGPLVGLVGLIVGIVFDGLILVVLLRLLTGAPLPLVRVREGAIVGAAVLGVLKLFAGFLIGHATSNPLLSAVALSVGLLFWLDLLSKVVLLAAAWAANDIDLTELGDDSGRSAFSRTVRPAFVAPPRPSADTSLVPYAAAAPRPSAGPSGQVTAPPGPASASRATDRVSLAAGAVVGAAAATAVSVARHLRRRR